MTVSVDKAKYDALLAENNEQKGQILSLQHRLDQLERMLFAAKTERYTTEVSATDQMSLWGQPSQPEVKADKVKVSYQRRRKSSVHPGRQELPSHLPVRREVLEPDHDTTGMVKIGEEITRKVNYQPGLLEIIETVRPKYARPEGEQNTDQPAIVIAPAADQVLPKAIAGAGLLVQIIIAKYIDHLPLYRQRQMFKRDFGWDIASSTMGDWFAATCTLLNPLYKALQQQVLQTDYLQGDESRITVLQRGEEQTKNKSYRHPTKTNRKVHLGYMWVFRNPVNKNVLFVYRQGRGAHVLHETLSNFSGQLQSDGFSAYTSFMKKHSLEINLISCLAHIRRKFFDAKKNHPELADLALRAIQYLYRIERICRDYRRTTEQRLALRQRYATPAFKGLLDWVNHHHSQQLSKDGIGKALLYAKNHLPRLLHYLHDPRIEIDNNQIENKIRPLALGRKNYLFAGSHKAAQRNAMMYSFFASCKDHHINPREWLTDVLLRIAKHPINQIHQLLPSHWTNG